MNCKVFAHEKVKALISEACNDSQHIHSWSKSKLSAEQGFYEGISFNQARIPTAVPKWYYVFCFKMYNVWKDKMSFIILYT